MKIGILTLHQSMNYGALLQAYALKTTLEGYGEVKLINYDYLKYIVNRCLSDEDIVAFCKSDLYADYVRKQLGKNSVNTLADPLVTMRKFITFRNNYLNLTPLLDKEQILSGELEAFDCIVSGSDQIWNAKPGRGIDKVFYQQIPGSAKKIAYAASIAGWSFTEEEEREVIEYMKSFSHVSLREREDAEYFTELTKKNIHAVLDPVFLLNKEHWLKFSENTCLAKEEQDKKYLLVYKPSNPRLEWFNEGYAYVAEKLGLEVKYVAQRRYNDLFPKDVPDPVDFVALAKNASFIYTNSFHGMAFAIIFNKPFAVTMKDARSLMKSDAHTEQTPNTTTNRFFNILDMLGINGRIMETFDDVINLQYDVEFGRANDLLKKEVEKSRQFIHNSISS